jgi:hypothetical protein
LNKRHLELFQSAILPFKSDFYDYDFTSLETRAGHFELNGALGPPRMKSRFTETDSAGLAVTVTVAEAWMVAPVDMEPAHG